jgi:pantetheine-phosphate adenylyltransferase
MKNKALFPGSFDPFTKGHEYILIKSLEIFEEITIGIGVNSEKNYLFDLDKRLAHITHLFSSYPNVNVQTYEGLTVTFCEQIKASHIVRGIRNSQDYEYEKSIAQMNKSLSGIESIFLLTDESVSPINSSIVREIHRNKGDISLFVTNPEILV